MSNAFSFDASRVEPSAPRELLPDNWYRMWITATEIKRTSKGDGEYLELEFAVLDGPYKGRKVWERLNIRNPNAQAQEIALRDLSAICRAVNTLKITTPQQLHRKPLLVKVYIEPAKGQYKEKNAIGGYREADGERDARPTVPDDDGDPGPQQADASDDDLPF